MAKKDPLEGMSAEEIKKLNKNILKDAYRIHSFGMGMLGIGMFMVGVAFYYRSTLNSK